MLFTLRKHWKKSTFAACLITYGFHYSSQRYREYLVRREFFFKAKKYGDELISPLEKPRRLYIILNPAAHSRKAKALFQKNAAPLFHLAGIDVTYIQTDYEGHGKTIVNYFDPTIDGVVVAGGNGTLQEIITGILRQNEKDPIITLPIGVVPIGENSNALYKRLFGSDVVNVRAICQASLAIVEGKSKKVNVVEIKTDKKSIFALNSIHIGLHQQVKEKIDEGKYWLFGPLRRYFACAWKSVKNWPPQEDLIRVSCTSCVPLSSPDSPKPTILNTASCSHNEVEDDRSEDDKENVLSTSGLSLWLDESDTKPKFVVQLTADDMSRANFIRHGADWIKNDFKLTALEHSKTMICNELTVTPSGQQDISYDIDGEIFDGKPINISVYPRQINMFCP